MSIPTMMATVTIWKAARVGAPHSNEQFRRGTKRSALSSIQTCKRVRNDVRHHAPGREITAGEAAHVDGAGRSRTLCEIGSMASDWLQSCENLHHLALKNVQLRPPGKLARTLLERT